MVVAPEETGRPRGSQLSAPLRAEAVGWVLFFRLALWALPFRRCLGLAEAAARWHRRGDAAVTPAGVSGALADVGRYVPRASCLPCALGAAVMLARAGSAPDLLLGTPAGRREGRFASHAWVEEAHVPVYGTPAVPHIEIARFPLHGAARPR